MKSVYATAAIALLAGGGPYRAIADDTPAPAISTCAAGEMRNNVGLSAEMLEISAALFRALCTKSGGSLVNGEDSGLGQRLVEPKMRSSGNSSVFGNGADRNASGMAVLAYVVEADGRVSWVAVLESTGNKDLDTAAARFTRSLVFKIPATLDGKAVRIYLMSKTKFTVISP
jgi:TonB family protein